MSAVQFCPSAPGNPKACSESCKPFFVMGFCRSDVCGQPTDCLLLPCGPARAFPFLSLFFFFPVLVPAREVSPTLPLASRGPRIGHHPYGSVPEQHTGCRISGRSCPILLRRCLLSQPSSKGLRAESGKETSASFPLPVVPCAGMFVMVRPAEGRNQARDMPSPPKTRTVSSSCQRCSRSRTALGP